MALTLAEAAKLSNDVLLQGVIETILKDSPILQVMPFIEIVGNGLTYNREATAPTAAFYDVGDAWAESTPTFTQVLLILDHDRAILRLNGQGGHGHDNGGRCQEGCRLLQSLHYPPDR